MRFRGAQGLFGQHRHSGRTSATWDWRDRLGDLLYGLGLHVADQRSFRCRIRPEIDNNRAWGNVFWADEPSASSGYPQQLRHSRERREVRRPRMTHRDDRVGVDQQQRQGHADDGTAAHDHRALSAQFHSVVLDQAQAAQRGCGHERASALRESTQVERVLTVDVFGRIDGQDGGVGVDACRQRCQQYYPIDVRVGAEAPHLPDKFGSAGGRDKNLEPVARELALYLSTVCRRPLIRTADQRQRGWTTSALGEGGGAPVHFAPDGLSDWPPFEQACGHQSGQAASSLPRSDSGVTCRAWII